jgi:hypothetical protein
MYTNIDSGRYLKKKKNKKVCVLYMSKNISAQKNKIKNRYAY